MRKEDYKRKPKRAYSKLKEIYGEDVNFPKSNIDSKQTGQISFKKHSYKPFYEKRFHKIAKRVFFLVLHTPGGDIAATESLVDYLYSMFGHNTRVIVSQISMSAGAMIALSAKEIMLDKHSNLGSIDPQMGG